jgi:hypothetical protein
VGTTIYPQERAGNIRAVGKESLPSAYILVIPNSEGPLFEMLQTILAAAVGHGTVVYLDTKEPHFDVVK